MAKWINQDQYKEGMKWQFCQNLSFGAQEQGLIIETAPNGTPIEMEYLYNYEKQTLVVDLEVQDRYEVIYSPYGTPLNPVIRLSILTGEFAAPYMRYILRRIEEWLIMVND